MSAAQTQTQALARIDAAMMSHTPDEGPKTFGFWIVRDDAGTTERGTTEAGNGDPLPETANGIATLGFDTRKIAQRLGRDWKELLARDDFGSPDWRDAHAALLRITLTHGVGLNSPAAKTLLGTLNTTKLETTQ